MGPAKQPLPRGLRGKENANVSRKPQVQSKPAQKAQPREPPSGASTASDRIGTIRCELQMSQAASDSLLACARVP